MRAIAEDVFDPVLRRRMNAGSGVSGFTANSDLAGTWVLVAGDFHRGGGMDRANAELAKYLCAIGVNVHLVSHRVDAELAAHPNAQVHRAPRAAGAHFLAQHRLDRLGRKVAADLTSRMPGVRVLVNGVNCAWPDINWIHFVHREWIGSPRQAPLWFKIKHGLKARSNSRKEVRVLRGARLLIANSKRTRTDLVRYIGVAPWRVHTIYPGCGPEWKPIMSDRRASARAWLAEPSDRPLAAFVGAFGHDERKGFDTLWAAWRSLCAQSDWDVDLIVAGGGRGWPRWQREIERSGLQSRVRLLGFTDRVNDVLEAADLLVSPVRYESYGLNVQEALACGIPAIVSRSAGVAERYPAELSDLLMPVPDDVHDLSLRLLRWRAHREEYKCKIVPLAATVRAWTWADMAAQIVAAADSSAKSEVPGNLSQEVESSETRYE